jgi:hypothetical protein
MSGSLGKAYQKSLSIDRPDELSCIEKPVVSAGVERGVATTKLNGVQRLELHIAPTNVNDLAFTHKYQSSPQG